MHIYLLARSFSLRCLFALAAFAAIAGLPGEAWAYSFLRFAAFTGAADGASPLAGVIVDGAGNLYGTTSAGAKGAGTVFKIAPGQPLRTVYTFCSQNSCIDGNSPRAALIMDDLGNLYGTSWAGGAHEGGAVFEITRGGSRKSFTAFAPKSSAPSAPTALPRSPGWSGTRRATSTARRHSAGPTMSGWFSR